MRGPRPTLARRRTVLWAVAWSLGLLSVAVTSAAAQQPDASSPREPSSRQRDRAAETAQETDESTARQLHLRWQPDVRDELTVFDPGALFPSPTDRELRLALWDSPMGRLQYDLSAHEALLGRSGLVNGERMLGIGLEATAFGSEPSTPTERWSAGARWSELSRAEKIQIGVEATVAAGVLWALLSNL